MLFKKDAFKNVTKFTEKHLCQSLFLNKVTGLRPATLLEKIIRHKVFSSEFYKIFKSILFIEHLRWLLLFRATTAQF